jgi:hypothetical protein
MKENPNLVKKSLVIPDITAPSGGQYRAVTSSAVAVLPKSNAE